MPKRPRGTASGAAAGSGAGTNRQARPAGAVAPPARRADDDDEEDEEEPEGEDLFDDNFLRDYVAPEEERPEDDDVVSSGGSFLDSASSLSDISEEGVAEVDAMIDRRHAMEEAAMQRHQDRRRKRQERELRGAAGLLDDGGGDSSSSSSGSPDASDVDNTASPVADDDRRSQESTAGPAVPGGTAAAGQQHDTFFDGEINNPAFDWTKPTTDVPTWLLQEGPRRMVKNRIYNFFYNFIEASEPTRYIYRDRVAAMTSDNRNSFEVSYIHLASVYEAVLAVWLANYPEPIIALMNEAASFFVFNVLFPRYRAVHKHVMVRISDVPVRDAIRGFRQAHRNVLICVEGVVTRRSPVYPQLKSVRYDCSRCSFIIGPIMQRDDREMKVSQCPSCHSNGPFRVNMSLTEFRNHQTIVLQEPPGAVPPGRLPRSLEVILTDDLIDRAKPGDHVDVTGIYSNNFDPTLNHRQGFPVFSTVMIANHLAWSRSAPGGSGGTGGSGGDKIMRVLLTDERNKLLELSRHPKIKRKLLASMAPSIHGHADIKLGLLLVLLGGVGKDVRGDHSHRVRGDINSLLVGDPGCAKSQFLKFMERTAERAVFTTGRGSTAVGLTAAVHRDPITGDFALEGGAMVIADRGVCLIDEFDKMSDQDRTSIHEAMEQQTISVARGGIVTSLSARCSVVAAANPIGGRYDPSQSFDANVDLTPPILSRFDLLFVVRDEVNSEQDFKLATFICKSHQRSHELKRAEYQRKKQEQEQQLLEIQQQIETAETDEEVEAAADVLQKLQKTIASETATFSSGSLHADADPNSEYPLQQSLLRSYISFARHHFFPSCANIDEHAIIKLYTEIRQECKHGGVNITVRHLESVLRLSEAHAKLHLRERVTDDDVAAASALFLRCFMSSQKYSQRNALEQKFRPFLERDKEPMQLLHFRLQGLIRQVRQMERQLSGGIEATTVTVDCSELERELQNASTQEALFQYYESPLFKDEFELVTDAVGHPSSDPMLPRRPSSGAAPSSARGSSLSQQRLAAASNVYMAPVSVPKRPSAEPTPNSSRRSSGVAELDAQFGGGTKANMFAAETAPGPSGPADLVNIAANADKNQKPMEQKRRLEDTELRFMLEAEMDKSSVLEARIYNLEVRTAAVVKESEKLRLSQDAERKSLEEQLAHWQRKVAESEREIAAKRRKTKLMCDEVAALRQEEESAKLVLIDWFVPSRRRLAASLLRDEHGTDQEGAFKRLKQELLVEQSIAPNDVKAPESHPTWGGVSEGKIQCIRQDVDDFRQRYSQEARMLAQAAALELALLEGN